MSDKHGRAIPGCDTLGDVGGCAVPHATRTAARSKNTRRRHELTALLVSASLCGSAVRRTIFLLLQPAHLGLGFRSVHFTP